MRGLCVPFKAIRRDDPVKGLALFHAPSLRRTRSLIVLPSTARPASLGMTTFITLPEVFCRGRARFSNRLRHGTLDLGRIHAVAEGNLERRDFSRFFLCEIFAAALAKLLDRIPPLFDEGDHHLLFLTLFECPPSLDLAVHQGGLGHPQRAEPRRLAGPHRCGHVLADPFHKTHPFTSFKRDRASAAVNRSAPTIPTRLRARTTPAARPSPGARIRRLPIRRSRQAPRTSPPLGPRRGNTACPPG